MKKKCYFILTAIMMFITACSYDDSDLRNAIKQDERIAALELWQKTTNENIAAIEALLNEYDYITDVASVVENNDTVGYVISFYKQGKIIIHNGEKGNKGEVGKDGETPLIGIIQLEDKKWYWTLNNELLKDSEGNPICANGKDGNDGVNGDSAPVPQVKTENGNAYISVDNGKTWMQISGKDGCDGDSFFEDIIETNSSVIFKFTNGKEISVPKSAANLFYIIDDQKNNIFDEVLNVPINKSFKIICETIKGVEVSYNISNNCNTTEDRTTNGIEINFNGFDSSSSVTIIFTVIAEDNQEFYYQVKINALEDGDFADTYMNSIKEHISAMTKMGSLDDAFIELANWLKTQPYIKEVSNIDNYNINFTYVNDINSFIAIGNNNLGIESQSRISDYESAPHLLVKTFMVESDKSDILIDNKKILFFDPLDWFEDVFWNETSRFKDLVSNSPIDLKVIYDTNGNLSTISEFSNYGVTLITKTHAYAAIGMSLPNDQIQNENYSCFAIPKTQALEHGLVTGLCLFINNILSLDQIGDLSTYEQADYTLVSPYYVRKNSGMIDENNKTIYAVYACNTFNQSTACNGNFIGTVHLSGRKSNISYMEDYFSGLFNGMTHLESSDQCLDVWERPTFSNDEDTKSFFKNSYPHQRYFSISTEQITTDDAKKYNSVPVSGIVNGYNNLKSDITFKIYYCEGDKDFYPDDNDVLSEKIKVDESGKLEHVLTSLEAQKTYSYRLGFEYSDKYYYGERKTFTTGESGQISTMEAIDLGLSVKWASYNLGASSPEEYGGLYGWGDPTGEQVLHCGERDYDPNTFTYDQNYCYSLYGGINPPTDISDSDLDIAHVKCGGSWRMPTVDEFNELVENCTVERFSYKGINGIKVTGKNGNSIFFPYCGGRMGNRVYGQGTSGTYWTSNLSDYTNHKSWDVELKYDYISVDNIYGDYRYIGKAIRPVRD